MRWKLMYSARGNDWADEIFDGTKSEAKAIAKREGVEARRVYCAQGVVSKIWGLLHGVALSSRKAAH